MIKAIETVYNGFRFRSRLEARWAVFFDTLGIPYEYEKEGYDLDGEWYLPDFWLPSAACWFEVKPSIDAAYPDMSKFQRLAVGTKQDVAVFIGSDFAPHYFDVAAPDGTRGLVFTPSFVTEHPRQALIGCWVECADCLMAAMDPWFMEVEAGEFVVRYRETPDTPKKAHVSIGASTCLSEHQKATGHDALSTVSPRLIRAYDAARQARFEHGERGR